MNYKKQIEEAIKKNEVFTTSELGFEDFNDQEFDLFLTEKEEGTCLRVKLSQSVDWFIDQEGDSNVALNDVYTIEKVSIYLQIVDIFDEDGGSIKETFHPQEIYHLENILEDCIKELQESDKVPTTKND